MAKKRNGAGQLDMTDYRHTGAKRLNNPPAAIASEGQAPKVSKVHYSYSPHLPPVLRFDSTGKDDRLPPLIEEAGRRTLEPAEQRLLAEALRRHEPWLEWAGKREQNKRGGFEVDPVVLHIHERVSAQAILRIAMREDVQRDLFADPQQPYKEAIQFYKHPMDWANRVILGDSLQVMSSLARRENLAGKVQMIYMDPPYGIKFGSNFQPELVKRTLEEKDTDLTREPETVRAYRDTWALGAHSYLTYLRERLLVARELLGDTGSIFVQMGDEGVARVVGVLDEVFGVEQRLNIITVKKKSSTTITESVADYLLWYAKDRARARIHHLRGEIGEPEDSDKFKKIELPSGERRSVALCSEQDQAGRRAFFLRDDYPIVSQDEGPRTVEIVVQGRPVKPGRNQHWRYDPGTGMTRLELAERVRAGDKAAHGVVYWGDETKGGISNLWTEFHGESDPVYVVQTNRRIVERCLLLTTDPGDIVMDPTCGSGTTAVVAEQWGRRWITCDTSRVAASIARQRLLTAKFEHTYKTKAPATGQSSNPSSGFEYRTIAHVTLKSIAQNAKLDPVFARHEPLLDKALASCNKALAGVSEDSRKRLQGALLEKQQRDGKRSVTEADRRRWDLPTTKDGFQKWTVPFDTDPNWPEALQDAVTAYRKAWRTKMDEVNACIDANAEQEELVDDPIKVPSVVRVSGPFTVEGVRPEEMSLIGDQIVDPTPNEFEAGDPSGGDGVPEVQNLHAYLQRMVQLLRKDGLTFMDNKSKRFARLDPLFESSSGSFLHAHGVWDTSTPDDRPGVAVAFGPQYGPVTAEQVERFIRAAKRYDELVVAGFSFDAEASAVIQEAKAQNKGLLIHQSYIRPDVNPAMDGLLKDRGSDQLFSVFGQPDVKPIKTKDGYYVCKLAGVDIYDPIKNVIVSTKAEKVTAWFLDSDYDGRCFCVTQAFFPDQDAWEKIAKALKSTADEEAFAAFNGTESLPFPAGKHKRIAVKVIDPRGNEVMSIKALE